MEALYLEGNTLNPTITLDHEKNIFVIEGESRPENPIKYFEPVFSWFNDYFNYVYVLNDLASSKTPITRKLKIDLDYFNSTSAKVLFDLFVLLRATGRDKFNITFEIDWCYYEEDVDMLDAGNEMETMCGLKFNYIPKT